MNENNDHLHDSMSYLSLPLYREFTRILIWPTQADDEESTYQVWSFSREIPPDIKSSEIKKIGLPFFKNHHYIAYDYTHSQMVDVARRARVEENQLLRLRQWAAGIRYQRRRTVYFIHLQDFSL